MNELAVSHQGLSGRILLFCVLTILLLCALAFAVMTIGHSPTGLFGAACIVLMLTFQQYLQKRSNKVLSAVATSQPEVTRNAG